MTHCPFCGAPAVERVTAISQDGPLFVRRTCEAQGHVYVYSEPFRSSRHDSASTGSRPVARTMPSLGVSSLTSPAPSVGAGLFRGVDLSA